MIMAFADLEPRAHHGVEQRRGNLADAAARLLNINAVFDDRCILISLGCGALAGERVDGEFLSRLHDRAADRLSAQADIGVSVGIGGGGGGKGRQAFELGFERRLVHLRSGFRHRDGHSAIIVSGIDRRLRRRLGCFLIDLQTVLPILIGKGGILDVKAGHGRVFRLAVDGLRAGVEHLGHIRQGIARFHGKLHRLGFDLFDLCKIFLTGAVSADLIGLIDHGSQIAARHQRHLESLVVILQRQAVLGKAQRLLDSFRRLLARHAAQRDAVDGHAFINGIRTQHRVFLLALLLRCGLLLLFEFNLRLLLFLRFSVLEVLHAGKHADRQQHNQQQHGQKIILFLLAAIIAAAAGGGITPSGRALRIAILFIICISAPVSGRIAAALST